MKKIKSIGAMLGLAIGDALGAPVEFKDRGSFELVTSYRSGGKFNLQAGEWTDDTAMALCLANSLIDRQGVNQKDQLQKYLKWFKTGYMSASGKSVGCGKTILQALTRFELYGCSECGNTRLKKGAGNGSLMRIAPIAIYYLDYLKTAMEMAKKSSYTTHGLKICADACMLYVGLIVGAINGVSKDELLSLDYVEKLVKLFPDYKFEKDILRVIFGSYKEKTREEIKSSGYVVHTLESALWAFYNCDNFKDGVLKAVNLGYDADTVGAVYGQLAGAYYGKDGIDKEFINGVMKAEEIEKVAIKLVKFSI